MQTLYNNRALAYLRLEQPKLAIADCAKALEAGWNSKAAYRHGLAAMDLGEIKLALQSFQAVVQREPSNRQARAKMKECQERLQDEEEETTDSEMLRNGEADEEAML